MMSSPCAPPPPPCALRPQIADTYSIVCKSQKKKKPPPENNGSKTLPRSFGGAGARGRGRGVQQGQARSQEEPGYQPVGDRLWSAEADPADAAIDGPRGEQAGTNSVAAAAAAGGGSATLKRKKQQQAAPGPPQGSGPPGPPVREHFYESIGDGKKGASSTTTIFTFNDGMEMYVTGL